MIHKIRKRSDDFSGWYQDVIAAARLADYSPVRGCMVIRPNGYALWEAIHDDLDARFKETGHVNAYFPLFIPVSFLAKEAQHIEGFAMQCAVVTHAALRQVDGGLVPASPLEEPLVVRPTSETIIGAMYAQWIHSWRDLPVLINQWANVVRWEMRTRLFLRTSEFLWQEGHTAHETAEEARLEMLQILDIYRHFIEEVLAIPVRVGKKTESERFAGADSTYCVEAMMPDGKALQAGTSHELGQNFARAFDIKFTTRDNRLEHVWTTSWGVSTRLIGALVMTHSDDKGLVLPPAVARCLAQIIPIQSSQTEQRRVDTYCDDIAARLGSRENLERAKQVYRPGTSMNVAVEYASSQRHITIDRRDTLRPSEKHVLAEQAGIPWRIEVGPQEVESETVTLKNRLGERQIVPLASLTPQSFQEHLSALQRALYNRAAEMLNSKTSQAGSYEELKRLLRDRGGFVQCHFVPDRDVEERIKAETKATVRLILRPEQPVEQVGRCIVTGRETTQRVLFAIAY